MERDQVVESQAGERAPAEERAPSVAAGVPAGLLQRKIARRLARRAAGGEGVQPGAEQAVGAADGSSGSPLPGPLQRKFEGSLGADLGGVRVHTGEASAQAASSVGARAYTTGNDIHFARGQYDPASAGGQHLLAHEVAHTVQQGGAGGAPQFKLEVSSPADAAEHEADRAADAMVRGAPAEVSPSGGAVARKLQRKEEQKEEKKEGGGPAVVGKPGGFTYSLAPPRKLASVSLEVAEIEAELSGSIAFNPAAAGGEGKEGEKKPVEVSAGVGADSKGESSVQLSAEKELEGKWGFTPKVSGGVELTKDGPKLNLGGAIEHPGVNLKGLQIGPVAAVLTGVSYDAKEGWSGPKLGIEAGVSSTIPAHFMGLDVVPALKLSIDLKPDYAAIGKIIAEKAATALASGAAGAAAAIAAPLIWLAAGLAGWAKAGHELDDFEARCRGAWATGKAAANLVCGRDVFDGIGGSDKFYVTTHIGDVTATAAKMRNQLASTVALKPEAIAAVAQAPGSKLYGQLYQGAWLAAWPDLRKTALAEFQDDWWHGSRQLERNTIESYANGPYAKEGT